jgi:hypothetical protein
MGSAGSSYVNALIYVATQGSAGCQTSPAGALAQIGLDLAVVMQWPSYPAMDDETPGRAGAGEGVTGQSRWCR